ncbi:ESPR-type extended signal peptide-containing protein, partial [Megamonas funiformis]|uniref:ESPR-type extended signal peptide-containing protein n=1 Tax=Megamonas funiformis TaxID=437897 RepID=UPI00402797C3
MNKIYKVIWSKVKHQYVVVSELAHSNGKQSRTSRNSIRSRIAALVVCGAIAAFGVFSALPTSSAFAAGAEATAGQYIAIGGANSSDGYYDRNTRTYYKYYTGSDNKPHKYIFTQTKQGNFWVREGYTIDIVNNPRFGGDDAGNPDKEIIINTYKGEGADSNGLVQSYQNVQESMNINTLNGDKLFSTGTAMYGGAVNTSSTQVTTGEEYIINEGKTAVKSNNIGQYFHAATYNEKTGLYSYKGKVVSNENLYVISGQVGVFTTTANGNEVYTGDVYGRNNEILMTGVKENGDYVSYWGAEVVDPNATIGSMTVSTLQGKFDEVDSSIEKIHKDDIKQIQVASATNGGTIGLQTNGEFNEDGTAKGGANIPGTITVTSEGGTGGDDVRIKFANEKGSFTVDAGSKVVANNGAGGTDLESISVNGQTFNVVGGAIAGQIDSEGNVKIQQGNKAPVTIGKVSDWNVKSGQINGSTLTLTTENAYDGNPKTGTVTIEGVASTNYVDGKDALNVKYDSTDKTSITLGKDGNKTQIHNVAAGTDDYDAVNFKQLQDVAGAEDYVKEGTINTSTGVIKLTRQLGGEITIKGLQDYVNGKDSYVTNATLEGNTLKITQNNQGKPFNIDLSGLTSGLSGTDYQVVANPAEDSNGVYSVSEDGTLKLTVKDLNNPEAEAKEVSISGIAQKDYVDAKDALNVKYDSADKTSVTLGGKGSKTPVKLTNVANGTSTYDAVNFSQLEAVQNAENYVTSGSIDNANGTITLKRVQGGDVTINGLQDYVNGKDSYVTNATLEGNTLKITQNNQGKPFNIDLSGLTSGLSSSDYQLVAPESGSYTVDDNGTLTLTVKDLNNPNAATKPITITGLAKKTDVAVIHDQYKDGEYTNLRDTKAQIWDETAGASDKKSSSIALGKDAFVSVQNGRKGNAILFGSDTYTGGIAIGQDSKALNGTVNIGVKDYTGKMGDVIVGDPNNRDLDNGEYNTYTAMGVGETSVGSNSYISGSLSTNIGSYNITTTKYGNTSGILGSLYSAQNFGSVIVGTLNSIESNSSSAGMTSGVANSVIGMANKTQNSNGSLVFGTGNEITNSTASIPSPSSVSGDVADVAENFRDSVSDRNKSNGGAVLAIGGGNKADYAQNSQLIGVQNEITGTSRDISKFNMINGYQNTITNGSNDTVIGTKNTVTNGDSNVVLGDNHAVQAANNNVIVGSSDEETTHMASDTVVIGHNAQANSNNDVAIGSGSVANGAVKTAGYAGANPIGTVSVGSAGSERTITNVAAGRINEDSTDAVNGSQLYATNQNVTNLTTKVDAGWSLYSNGKEVKNVKPGNNLVNIDSGENVSITKNEDGNGITISADLKDLDVEDTNAVLYDNEGKTSVTLGGTGHEAVKLTNVA